MRAPKAVERWLDDGWSPSRIVIGGASLVTLVVTVYGYVVHPHHPGAVWWLLGVAGAIAFWTSLEMTRWRVKHNRLERRVAEFRHIEAGQVGQLAALKQEHEANLKELEAARQAQTGAAAAVNRAEWDPTCEESGEFPDNKALMFGLWHRFRNPAARMVFGDLRCAVTDPDQITTSATGTANYYQYVDYFFKGAPPVRPGLYLFKWQGQKSNGEWVDVTSGEYEVKGPNLFVEIMEPPRFESWRRTVLIAALRIKITNTTRAIIRLSSIGFSDDPEGLPGWGAGVNKDERLELERELHARRERQHYGIPLDKHATVPAGESITGWVVAAATRNPKGGTPSCTVVIKDELGNEYRVMLPKREPQTHG